MPSYSSTSESKLMTCHYALQRVFNRVIRFYNNTIIEGHRNRERQNELYAQGRTQVQWPGSRHNKSPSEAVDSAPYIPERGGIPWPKRPACLEQLSEHERAQVNQWLKDTAQFYHYAGVVQGVAEHMGVSIRWGGDWDRDHCLSDQTFDDLVHFEVVR